ncbi:MAG: hypothetical protein KFF68_00445 [Desulfosarcina sp.]|nr:hypothetical protein [Desulfosarcina sp.]
MQEKKQPPVRGRTAGEQRTGIDRRVLSYDWYIPERRAAAERRLGRKYAISDRGGWRDRLGAEG